MRLAQLLLTMTALLANAQNQTVEKPVVAHFMIGTVYSYEEADWKVDIAAA